MLYIDISAGFCRMYLNAISALLLLRAVIFWSVSLSFMFCVFFLFGIIGVSLLKDRTDKFTNGWST